MSDSYLFIYKDLFHVNKKNNGVFLIIFSLTVLNGCVGGTSNCTDDDVKDTIVNIVISNVKKAQWGKELFSKGLISDVKVTRIKTIDYNKDLDQYTCSAKLSFKFQGEENSKDIKYINSYLEDEGETDIVVYGVDDVKTRMLALAISIAQ